MWNGEELAVLTVNARRVPANAQMAIEFGVIRLPLSRSGLCNARGMLDEFREILFTNRSFCDAAKYAVQIFHRFYRMLPIVALPASASASTKPRTIILKRTRRMALPRSRLSIAGSLGPEFGYLAVPPTVMRSMRRVGWPTPTGTP